MKDDKKTYLFEQMPVAKAIMSLSVPTVLSSLVMVIYNLADTYFVGMLNNSIQNAAVTLAAPVLLAFNAVNNLFGVGTSSMMSRALGRKDYETVYKSSSFGFYCALLSGLLFSLLYTVFRILLLNILGADDQTFANTAEYLKWTVSFGAAPAILNVVMAYMVRAEGSSLHASIGTMSGCFLNIILDPVFILPDFLDMGAAGAGLATFISNCAACLYFFILIYVRRSKTFVCINPKKFIPTREIAGGIFAVGIPASIQNLLNVTGMTVLNNFTSSYSNSAVAAMGIAQKINMIPMNMAMGVSQGIMPLISYNYSSGNINRMKKTIKYAAFISLSFLTFAALMFYLFSGGLIRLFMKDSEVVTYGTRFLRGFCLGLPFLCFDFLVVGVFQACGFGRNALFFAISRKILLEIPAIIILNMLFPLYGLAYSQFTAEFIMTVIAAFTLFRLFRNLDNKFPGKNA